MREFVREHWPLAAALGLILVANLFALYDPANPNRERHQAFSGMWNRMQLLRDQQASPDAWEELAGEIPATIQPIIGVLNQESDVHHPIEQHLLWAGRDYLLPLLKEYQEESRIPRRGPRRKNNELAAKERRFQLHMDEAARLFDNER
jgi:hypothetical protein